MKITLKNDFHGTHKAIFVSAGDIITDRQARKIKSVLCGASGCTCSGGLGTRGPQDAKIAIEQQCSGYLVRCWDEVAGHYSRR